MEKTCLDIKLTAEKQLTKPVMNHYDDEAWWKAFGRPFTEEELEAYKLWFEFLQLSDRTKWSDEVQNDFGDLTGDFDSWWPDHSHLFRQMKHHTITEIKTIQDFEFWQGNACTDEYPGTLVLAVPLYEPKDSLINAFKKLLSEKHKGKSGRPEFDDWADVYRLCSRPNINMLKKILAIYKLHSNEQIKKPAERMTLWQIEEEVSKTTPLILKQGREAEYLWTRTDKSAEELLVPRRKSQSNTVSKYLEGVRIFV